MNFQKWLVCLSLIGGATTVQAASSNSTAQKLTSLRRVAPVDCVRFGRLETWEGFDFGQLLPRNVSVWLPPQPFWDGIRPLPVWYIHDGQNLWDPRRGYGGQTWDLDSLMERYLAAGQIEPCILVALDNSPQRFRDYLPPPCLEGLEPALRDSLQKERSGTGLGDAYARWITGMIQPWLIMQYPVDTNPASHYLMGASMGGLISSYTVALLPDRFGGAACLSTHWPLSLQKNILGLSLPYRSWLAERLSKTAPQQALHSLYMDHGDQTLDAFYPVHQNAFDSAMRRKNLPNGFRFGSKAFPGTAHTERDWSKRCLDAMIWVMQGKPKPKPSQGPPPPSQWNMYFALIDRWTDGDTANNRKVPSTYDPQKPHYHHGGDLEGLRQKIPYLKSLNINALWITPPVLNQNFNPDSSITGYHGYWASDFRRLDPRWGTLREFKRLGRELEENGIALIQDVVVNHAGDYFEVQSDGHLHFHNSDRPKQPLLRHFPPNSAEAHRYSWHSRHRSVYHRLPSIQNYRDSLQKLQGQMSGLDDLRTECPELRRRLRRAYQKWVKRGRLRGMRMDTPIYVEKDFWEDFLHRPGVFNPGLQRVAEREGRNLWTFGELWTHSEAWSDLGEQEAATYTLPGQGLDAALQFPLQKTMMEVLGGTRGTAHLSYRLDAQQKHFPNPLTRIQFLDNHDMPRLRSRLDSLRSAQALLLLYTLPGIPVLYYGTELGTQEPRATLFDANYENGPFTSFIRQLSSFRQRYPILQTAEPTILLDSRLGSPAWVALVGGRWLVGVNPGKQATQVPDSLITRCLGEGWTILEKPEIHTGGPIQRNSNGWTLEPGQAWVWGLLPPSNDSQALSKLEAPYPLPQNLEKWLKDSDTLASITDPSGDDLGSNGLLLYPKAFEGHSPGDLAGLRWLHSPTGGYILEIQMHEGLSQVWNPPHGLDHLHLDIEWRVTQGDTLVSAPFSLNGWTASGSQPWEWYSRPLDGKIYAVFGAKHPLDPWIQSANPLAIHFEIRVQTWDVDGDGRPRPLKQVPSSYEFGGDPKAERWMDRCTLRSYAKLR